MKIAIAGATGLIGSQLTDLVRQEGHEVVELARATGFDLLAPDDTLAQALQDVETVVDVTASPSLDEQEATDFFTTVAENLGRAAAAAGIDRTVVLSIVGIDEGQDYGFYVAKRAQERATRAASPGAVVLRATQFHEFAGQMLDRSTSDGVAHIIDVPSRPVASAEVARLLLELADGSVQGDAQLAGPRQGRLVDQVRRLVAHTGSEVTVEAAPAPTSMADGSMLPGPEALVRGPDWQSWLDQQP